MTHSHMTNSLELHWLPVVGDDGRTRLEARWLDRADAGHAAVTQAA